MKPSKNPKENNILAESGLELSNDEMEKVTGGMSASASPRKRPGYEGSFTSLDQAMAKPKEDITWEDFKDTCHWLVKGDHYIG